MVTNTGPDTVTCTGADPLNAGANLGLNDTDLLIGSPSPALNTSFTTGASQTINASPACTTALNRAESSGDTANLLCACAPLTNNTTVKDVAAADDAIFSCQQPELTVVGTCTQSDSTLIPSVTVTDNGAAPLTNCSLTDGYQSGACPETITSPILLPCPATRRALHPTRFRSQRAAAELNLAVTTLDGGTCEGADAGITGMVNTCCGDGGVCATQGSAELVAACVNGLDAFNNQFDNVTLTVGQARKSKSVRGRRTGWG